MTDIMAQFGPPWDDFPFKDIVPDHVSVHRRADLSRVYFCDAQIKKFVPIRHMSVSLVDARQALQCLARERQHAGM